MGQRGTPAKAKASVSRPASRVASVMMERGMGHGHANAVVADALHEMNRERGA